MTKNKMDKEKIEEGVRLILEGIGEDINREGLLETPDRIARMYKELAAGYTDDAAKHLKKRFHVDNNDMVLKKDIPFIPSANTIRCLSTVPQTLPIPMAGWWIRMLIIRM